MNYENIYVFLVIRSTIYNCNAENKKVKILENMTRLLK